MVQSAAYAMPGMHALHMMPSLPSHPPARPCPPAVPAALKTGGKDGQGWDGTAAWTGLSLLGGRAAQVGGCAPP